WWMGDTVSDLVIAPAVLLWAAHPRVRWTRREALEAVALLACLAIVGITVFDGLVPWKDKHYPLEFLCVPLLLWAAFRFEQREAATVVLLLAGVAIWGTLRGYGPFARPLFNESRLVPGDRHRRAVWWGRVRAGPARDRGRGGVARGPARRRPGGAGRRAAAALGERRRRRASARRGDARGAPERRGPLAVRQ